MELVKVGKFDLVIGRDEEVWWVVSCLFCWIKNNFVFIGELGVGKIAIVEGLV